MVHKVDWIVTCTISPLLIYIVVISCWTPLFSFMIFSCALVVQHIFVNERKLAGGSIRIAIRCESLTRCAWGITDSIWKCSRNMIYKGKKKSMIDNVSPVNFDLLYLNKLPSVPQCHSWQLLNTIAFCCLYECTHNMLFPCIWKGIGRMLHLHYQQQYMSGMVYLE